MKKRAAVAATSLHSDEYIKVLQYRDMANITAEGTSAIWFPKTEVLVASPEAVFKNIVAPQTNYQKKHVYLPGPVTSGNAINIAPFNKDIGWVIKENTLFAITFWNCLLASQINLHIPEVGDIRDAQLLAPHAQGKTVHPLEPSSSEPGERWGEYDFYSVQFAWFLGIRPELFMDFTAAMLDGVALDILKDYDQPRPLRRLQTIKIADNIERYLAEPGTIFNPTEAMVALPNPDTSSIQSLGSELETDLSDRLAIPHYHTVIHPESARKEESLSPAMQTIVGSWMLDQFTTINERAEQQLPNLDDRAVTFQRRGH